jgi:uncharacterized protein YacL (UPF0231 family)
MDHEFCYDESGELVVRLDMGQEVTALWLNTEIIPKRDMAFALLDLINDLESGTFNEKLLATPTFEVMFSAGEVNITRLTSDSDDDFDEDAGLSTMELTSGCGLEDLKAVVESWIQFRY